MVLHTDLYNYQSPLFDLVALYIAFSNDNHGHNDNDNHDDYDYHDSNTNGNYMLRQFQYGPI